MGLLDPVGTHILIEQSRSIFSWLVQLVSVGLVMMESAPELWVISSSRSSTVATKWNTEVIKIVLL